MVNHTAYEAVFPGSDRQTELISLMLKLNLHVKKTIRLTDDQGPVQGWALLSGCAPDPRFVLCGAVKHKAYVAVFPRVKQKDRQTEPTSLIFMLTLNIYV